MNFFVGQIIQCFNRRSRRSRNQQLFDIRDQRIGKINLLLALRCDGQVGGRNITAAFNQPGQQLIAPDGNK